MARNNSNEPKAAARDMESEEFRKEHPEFFQTPPWLETPALTGDHTVYIPPLAPANAEQPAVFDGGKRSTEYVDPAVGETLFTEAQAAEQAQAEQDKGK